MKSSCFSSLITTTILLLLSFGVFSQSINVRGAVTDGVGSVVPGAKVFADDANSGRYIEDTVTDSAGEFVLKLPNGTYNIEVRSPGFINYKIERIFLSADGSINLKIAMHPSLTSEELGCPIAELDVIETATPKVHGAEDLRLPNPSIAPSSTKKILQKPKVVRSKKTN